MATNPPTPIELKSRFAAAVKQRRRELGITQEELAWRAGLHRTYLANVESGTRNLSLRSIGKLARGLELSFAALFTLMEKPGHSAAVALEDAPVSKLVEVLLVEDDRDAVQLTLRAFEAAGLANRVHVAADGAAALEYLVPARRGRTALIRPHLILLDLGLPKGSALKFLERIRSDARTRDIPVIALCSSKKDRDASECRRFGVHHFILKPLDFRNLSDATRHLKLSWALWKEATA